MCHAFNRTQPGLRARSPRARVTSAFGRCRQRGSPALDGLGRLSRRVSSRRLPHGESGDQSAASEWRTKFRSFPQTTATPVLFLRRCCELFLCTVFGTVTLRGTANATCVAFLRSSSAYRILARAARFHSWCQGPKFNKPIECTVLTNYRRARGLLWRVEAHWALSQYREERGRRCG